MTVASGKRPLRFCRTLLSAAIAIVAAGLSGCASTDPGAAPTPTSSGLDPSATALLVQPVTGTGPTGFPGVDFAIPSGARSVAVDFACAGSGRFSLELGDSMMLGQPPLAGTWGSESELSWPVTKQTGPTLSVTVPERVDWVATPTFSTTEFVYDTALRSECEQFSPIYSALFNADSGFTYYGAIDAAEWTSRIDQAAADLDTLSASAQSPLRDAFAQLHPIIGAPDRTVGAVLTEAAQKLIGEIGEVCGANQTPLFVVGEFGG